MLQRLTQSQFVLASGLTASVFLLPFLAHAQIATGSAGGFGTFISAAVDLINNFLIPLLIALCVLAFVYGIFLYFIAGSDDDEKRAKGRNVLLYAIIGFVAIVALWGIVTFVQDAFGFDAGTPGTIKGPSAG